jgi:hypothetical protein
LTVANTSLFHPEQPRFMFSAWLWAVTLFIFFGVIVLISFSAMHRGSDYEEARAKARMEKLKTAREEAAKALTTYGWIDKAKGAAHIPIDRAMELTLADLRTKKPTAANPIATPVPAAPAPAANTAGAASPVAQPAASGTPKPNSIEGPNSMIGGQPAAGANPPAAPPATQPGTSATPAASTGAPAAQPAISPTGTPVQTPPGTPPPVPGKTP